MISANQKSAAGCRAVPCPPAGLQGRSTQLLVGTVQRVACRHAITPLYESVGTADDVCTAQETGQGPQAPIQADVAAQQPTEHWWRWKWGSRIRYYKAGHAGLPPLVLVHGFGVGCWHFEHNMEELSKSYHVFAVELLGQGSSWPAVLSSTSSMSISGSLDEQQEDDAATHGPLHFSVATWTQQLTQFVQQVVGAPAYVAGNSLGGFLAVSLAFHEPDLVRGLVLLNSTPFWSMRPSLDQPQGLWGWLGFDGAVPAPPGLKRAIELLWWNQLRNRHTIKEMLSLVYVHKQAARSDSLVDRIIAATEQPGALDAFASIMMSPKSSHDFDSMLRELRCPVCLVYGKQDPWVVPMWGQRAAYNLLQAGKPLAMYLELNEAGHCPHHEAPAACNTAMHMCLTFMDQLQTCKTPLNPLPSTQQGSDPLCTNQQDTSVVHSDLQGTCPPPPLPVGQKLVVSEACGRQVTIEHVDGRPRHVGEYVGWLSCLISDRLGKGRSQAATTAAAGVSGATQAAAAENQQ